MTSTPAQIGVLDDEADVREALASILAREGFEVRTFADVAELLTAAARDEAPDVLLADLDLGGERFADAMGRLAAQAPSMLVVAVTGHAEDAWLFPAIEAGCVGYVLKSDAFVQVADVVREVLRGGSPMTREISRRVLRRMREPDARPVAASATAASADARPSERELAVLRDLAEGYTYEQVALRLGVSISTVRTYVSRLYGKLGVSTKSEATRRAMRLGLID